MMKYQDQKQIGKRRTYLIPQLAYSPSSGDGKGVQDRKLEAGTDAQVIEEHCLLVCPPWLCSVYFPIVSRTTNPGEVPPTSKLGPPISNKSINQSNVPLAHMAIWRCIFQLRFLFLNDSKFVNLN